MKRKEPTEKPATRRRKPATTPEAREKQLISLAYDLVEQRLIDGTATSQETTHFLRLGSAKERIERDILERQKELITAKTEQIKSTRRIEELYAEALSAMKRYSGETDGEDEEIL